MKYWPHAPCHIVDTAGTFIHFAEKYKWMLQAWAIFPNHYHFIAQSPSNPQNLSQFLQHYHSETAIHLNKLGLLFKNRIWLALIMLFKILLSMV